MKKVISLILTCIVVFASVAFPTDASTLSYDIPKSKAVAITAKDYSAAYDYSEGDDALTIEGGNISFQTMDYVDYVLNVETAGIYTLAINGSGDATQTSVLDILLDEENQLRQTITHIGWSNFQNVTTYIYIPSGTHTLRIYNVEVGFYLSKLTLTYKAENVNLGYEETSVKPNVAGGISGMKRAGTTLAFSVNVPEDGIYRLNIKSTRSTSADIYIYSNINFLNEVNIPSGSGTKNNYAFLKLKAGQNIVKMNIVTGLIYLSDITMAYQTVDDEADLKVAIKEIESLNDNESVYSKIKENENLFGVDIDSLTSGIENPEFVFIRLTNRTYSKATDFFEALYNAIEKEKNSPSISKSVANGTLSLTVKTDIYENDGALALAIYNGKKLIATNFKDFTKGTDVTLSVSGYSDGMNIKYFIFDSISDIQPVDLSYGVFAELYVSKNGNDESGDGSKERPFATLAKAKEKVAELSASMTGDIIVNIEPGTYELSETEVFGISHGGKDDYKVIYRGTDEENKPIISGGKKVSGWQKTESGIYKAPLSGTQVRNLYVGDYPARRAQSKYTYELSEFVDTLSFKSTKEGMPESFSHPEDLVLVWNLYWATQYTPVESVTYGEKDITFKMGEIFGVKAGTANIEISKQKRFYMENAPEFLDEPGEFYHDSHEGYIYYMPYPEENMETIDTYVSNLDRTISVEGTGTQARVKNIVFDNLSIRHGTWNTNSVMQIQADQHITKNGQAKFPAQFVVNNADSISVENCEFACIGSNALEFFDSVSNSKISGNIVRDVSGTGISVGNFMRPRISHDGAICTEIEVSDNILRRTSIDYRGTTAIAVYYENDIDVVRNDIADLSYTGITAGWGWGTARENFGHINISQNRIHNVMQVLMDGGHIYTLGNIKGGVIEGNYMTKSGDFRGGIYTDSGSQSLKLLYNVCDNSSLWWHVGLYYTKNMYAEGNVSPRDFVNDSGENIVIKNHKAVSNGNFESVAADIISEAGLSDEFEHLKNKVSYPTWRKSTLDVPLDTYRDTKETWIEAEDFMEGFGTGYRAYNFNEPYNNVYRPEGLNLYPNFMTNKGYYIHRVAKGDWMAYSVTVPEDGTYYFDLKAANGYDSSYKTIVDVSVDGSLKLNDARFPSIDTWNYFETARMGKLQLTKGTHTIKIAYAGSGFHIDAFRLVNEKTRIDMSDYTEGYCEFKGTNSLPEEGGCTTWHIGDFGEYEVYIPHSGTYTFGMKFGSSVGSGLKLSVKADGEEKLNVLKTSLGTFADRKDVDFGNITFDKAGIYKIRIENIGGNGGHYAEDFYFNYQG